MSPLTMSPLTMRRRTALIAAAALLAGGTVLAKPKNKDGAPKEYIQWMENFDAAKAEAAERNVPLVFAWHKDN